MSSAGFEPTVPATEMPQTGALDRATTESASVEVQFNEFLISKLGVGE